MILRLHSYTTAGPPSGQPLSGPQFPRFTREDGGTGRSQSDLIILRLWLGLAAQGIVCVILLVTQAHLYESLTKSLVPVR